MRVPQVNERVKEAPAQALRAMFAGIGQLMLFTDRLRNRPADEAAKEAGEAKEGKEASEASVPAQAPAPESAAPESPAPAAETVVAQETEEVAEAPAPAAEETTPAAPAATTEAPEAPAAPAASAAEPPLPNYDELTVPSLRARMRNLTADQLNELIAYEGAHANRADVIAMFQRRVAKLAEG